MTADRIEQNLAQVGHPAADAQAVVGHAIKEQRAADATADVGVEEMSRRDARAAAEFRVAPGHGVVGDHGGQAEGLLQPVLEGKVRGIGFQPVSQARQARCLSHFQRS